MAAHIGEYIVPRFVKIPAPSSTAPGANGVTLDAGTAIILDSNTTWLCRESVRQFVAKGGPGSVSVFNTNAEVYTGSSSLIGPTRADVGSSTVGEIPWDRRTAVRIGPVQLISDEENDTGLLVPRKVRFSIHVSKSGGVTLDLYAAITRTESSRLLWLGDYLAFGNSAGVSAGTNTIDLEPDLPVPSSTFQPWRNQADTSDVSPTSLVCTAWLWVGWRAVGAGTASINGYSILETR